MKRTVITFGLISGGISSAMMLATLPFIDRIGFSKSEILGYTTIVLSFLLVFFGVRSFRDNTGGAITFGRAFKVGILITLISCVCYVVTWEILYFTILHNFVDKYAGYMVDQVKASGGSPEQIQAQLQQMKTFRDLYKNPVYNVAVTFTEPFPIGAAMTLISAAVLRKRRA